MRILNESEVLVWCIAELAYKVRNLEGSMSANSDAIEAVVAELTAAKAAIVAKIDALQTAVNNGEDLSGPLADLKAAADGIDGIVPAAPAAPSDGSTAS